MHTFRTMFCCAALLSVTASPFAQIVVQPPSVVATVPDFVVGPVNADAAGRVTIGGNWPSIIGGYDFFLQYWIKDSGGVSGFAASTGLSANL